MIRSGISTKSTLRLRPSTRPQPFITGMSRSRRIIRGLRPLLRSERASKPFAAPRAETPSIRKSSTSPSRRARSSSTTSTSQRASVLASLASARGREEKDDAGRPSAEKTSRWGSGHARGQASGPPAGACNPSSGRRAACGRYNRRPDVRRLRPPAPSHPVFPPRRREPAQGPDQAGESVRDGRRGGHRPREHVRGVRAPDLRARGGHQAHPGGRGVHRPRVAFRPREHEDVRRRGTTT